MNEDKEGCRCSETLGSKSWPLPISRLSASSLISLLLALSITSNVPLWGAAAARRKKFLGDRMLRKEGLGWLSQRQVELLS